MRRNQPRKKNPLFALPAIQELLRIESVTLESAQKEADEEMSDLLVCLGQETAKVERLSAALSERGVNIEEILQGTVEL